MLQAVLPLTAVDSAICPCEDAKAMLLVIHILALELVPVSPDEVSLSVHDALLPLAFIALAAAPDVRACASYAILSELAFIRAAIEHGKLPMSVLLPIHKWPFEDDPSAKVSTPSPHLTPFFHEPSNCRPSTQV
eukprot:CAMPEP_0178378282 /NCGR_PEP_ID=MMETSP0689_2-20121128/4348_1 /TAXON_ID=160604 /ORGANISM="Amphidinium massartii, Strain CS-259" /LENGTH=133 /DNA_ID=CAMNT_0019998351 /DNA_START=182 /DNA_END=584 /DNA_ORIENTATION=+